VAGDSELAEAIKLVARAHQSLIWDRTRQVLRLRGVLREFFPAALEAFAELDAADALELLAVAPDPDRAARLSKSRIVAALRRANRRGVEERADAIQSVLWASALRQSAQVQPAFAAIVTSQVRLISALNGEIAQLGEVVADHFGRHPGSLSHKALGDRFDHQMCCRVGPVFAYLVSRSSLNPFVQQAPGR
jgi:hypothetical protein